MIQLCTLTGKKKRKTIYNKRNVEVNVGSFNELK